MKASKLWMSGLALLGVALIATPPVAAQADDPEAYGDDYQSGDAGRLRYVDGGATIRRAGGDDVDDRAATNAPLFPGDRVGTDRSQRVEIELAGGTILRLDRDTDVTFQSLPRPGAKFQDNTVIQLDGGVLRANARVGSDDEFRVDTPAGSVYLLGDGDLRIEADASGRTNVYSRRGVAEVVGEGGSVLVRGGSGTTMQAGAIPEDPRPFRAAAGDGFDRWVDTRDAAERTIERHDTSDVSADELPVEVRPYYRELSAYGNWVNVPDYGWAWSPYDAGPSWRPYYDGYWSYGPSGYFWVGNEPWGWAPYRYGRWSWLDGYGWFWCPGRVFAGAWVSWSWGSLYVGWAPLSYWGYPAYVGGYHGYHGHYYDPHCWTFVDYQHIATRDVHRHAIPIARVEDDVRQRPAVLRAPNISPRRLAESGEWRNRAAREAAKDPRFYVRQATEAARPTKRLQDVENRLIARGARTATEREGASSRDERRVRSAPDADRTTPERRVSPGTRATPGNRAPSSVRPPAERGKAPATRATPEDRTRSQNRSTGPTVDPATGERTPPSARPSTTPTRRSVAGVAREPLPRRFVADPRASRERAEPANTRRERSEPARREQAETARPERAEPARREQAETARQTNPAAREAKPGAGDNRRRELAPSGTKDRVRDLYDRLSRTGEMRKSSPRDRGGEAKQIAPEPKRPAPQSPGRTQSLNQARPERVQPREARPQSQPEPRPQQRVESRERARPEARPTPSPRSAPAKPAPRPQRSQGDAKRNRK